MRARVTALLPAMLVPPALAGLLLLLFRGDGFPNYDTEYALVWGRSLAGGEAPDTSAYLSPTPHPLANAAGAVLALFDPRSGAAPLGTTSEDVVTALAFVWLGLLAYLVFRLGREWGRPGAGITIGAVAALLVLTREPVLSFGVRAYVDIPYVCLVLAALLRETRRPRDGTGVLVLLALAGLLRPEPWLFAAAYLVYLWWPRRWETPRLALLVALAAAGPVLWALHDLLITGDPLYSLTGTQDNADELGRATGFDDLPVTGSRRLGEIAREPVLLGALVGGALLLARRRDDHAIRVGLAALVLSGLAFALLASAGLPIITRYLLLPAVLLSLLAAAALTTWSRLPREDRLRRPGAVAAAAVAFVFVVLAPGQVDRIDRLRDSITIQTEILADLRELTRVEGTVLRFDGGVDTFGGDGSSPLGACRPVAVPNQRAVPQLALWLGVDPSDIVVTQREGVPPRGVYVRPSSPEAARRFVLDPRDARKAIPPPPPGAERTAERGAWTVDATACGG